MSNSRSDDTVAVIVPADFDWSAAAQRIDEYGDGVSRTDLYRAFCSIADRGDDDLSYLLAYPGHPSRDPSDEELEVLREVLREDLALLRERVDSPATFERASDNFTTYGYGFSSMRVGAHLVMIGSENEFCAAAGEVEEWDRMEFPTFGRLIAAGIVDQA